ncbi:LysR family transcriptional regulator [Bradyrhizobium genosp. P]|uniref:LysR family transcriptional regulator n=1 Tax=Bradyrhizobium genosp. P TaxID=83641 RepID=UPI003CF83107
MEFRQFSYFLRACDYGSIAAAAERIGTVQSNVSMQISQLEHELGADLCKRSSAGLVPTLAGEHFYRLAQGLTAEMEFVSRYVRSSLQDEALRIALAAPMAPRGSLMAEALQAVARLLGKSHPHVKLRLIDFLGGPVTTNDEIRAVAEARADRDIFDTLDVRDRWGFVTRRGETTLPEGLLSLSKISSFAKQLKVVMPKLPPTIAALGEDFAKSAGIALAQEDLGIAELERTSSSSSNAVLLPLSCMPGFSVQQRFQIAYADCHPSDPIWRIESVGNADRRIIGVIAEVFSDVLRALLPRSGKSTESPRSGAKHHIAKLRHENEKEAKDQLTFRELRVFDAAYDRGNISRAAADIGVSQPALSNTLRKLEQGVGHKLFVRTAHGIMPTERAVLLRRLCEPILSDLAEARRQIRDLGRQGAAPIRIGILPVLDDESLLAVTIADAISEWNRLSTGSELRLTEGFSTSLRRWTVQEMLDFAIVDTDVRQSGLLVTPLSRDAMVVVTNPRLHVLPLGPVRASDVLRLKLVLPSARHGLREIIQRAFSEAGLSLAPKLEIDSMAMTLNLVKADDWATVLPVSAIYKRAQANELQVNVIKEPSVERSLSLIRRTSSRPSANVTRFIDILTKRIHDGGRSMQDLAKGPGSRQSSKVIAPLTE